MIIKRAFGQIIGAKFNKTEEKAIEIEVNRRVAEALRASVSNIDTTVLWVLNEKFGFGEARLKKFYDEFLPALYGLADHYELGDGDRVWLCKQKLLEKGIDIDSWEPKK